MRTLVNIKDHAVAILKPVVLLLCFARNHPGKLTQPKSHEYPPVHYLILRSINSDTSTIVGPAEEASEVEIHPEQPCL